jgi:pimeloyl-ACP methyl ester carboxylesterase
MATNSSFVTIGDAEIEVRRRGAGPKLLLLPGEDMLETQGPFLDGLARDFEVIIPSPPGFGRSSLPDWMTTIDDIAYVYLSLLERLEIEKAAVIGCSLGGWLAAEMATKDDRRLASLILIDPYGVKLGSATDRDIVDIWQLSPAKVAALKWLDAQKGERDTAKLDDAELAIVARNQESFARFSWEPYMHNPKLRHRLDRVAVPTLFLWGDKDGIVSTDYGKGYSRLIPQAKLQIVPKAGHYPHLENPDAVLPLVREFLRGNAR